MQNHDSNRQRPLRDAGTEQLPPPNQTLRSIQQAHPLGRHQRSEDSWVEVSSQPSSSSLSSAADEIITTGLRVRHDSNARRRRRHSHGATQLRMGGIHHVSGGGGSSQEEYDESESESDRVMTSSNEAIRPSPLHQHQEVRRSTRAVFSTTSSDFSEREEDDEDDDDDENSTAVNYPRATRITGGSRFTPQPNAFSHPPTTQGNQTTRSEAANTHFSQSRSSNRPAHLRNAYSTPQHTPYNVVSPSYPADHDAALRASLSTLLSAAAAVRGLPKPGQPAINRTTGGARVDPSSLRLVPEAVAMGTEPQIEQTPAASSPSRDSTVDKYKRKAIPPSTTRSSSKDRRAVKKARKMGPIMMDEISPTLLTWVVSAGVVVLVSAISFSAGYVVGREAGHAEAAGQLGSVGADAGRCGREAAAGATRSGMGLRRLRWTSSSGVRV